MNYKSTRLLVETIHREMEVVRKILMVQNSEPTTSAIETMNELRVLVEQLAVKADKQSLDDLADLTPGGYVAAMKPLVANYHRQLMVADRLVPCLCEDLQAVGCVVVLIGDGKTVVRTAHDPNRPEVAIAVDAILAAIDAGTKKVVADGEEALRAAGLPGLPANDDPDD